MTLGYQHEVDEDAGDAVDPSALHGPDPQQEDQSGKGSRNFFFSGLATKSWRGVRSWLIRKNNLF